MRTIVAITRSAKAPGLEKLITESHGRVVNVVITDITDESVVRSALPEIQRHLPGGVLDVLINNAGVMPFSEGTMETVSNAQLQDVFRTNVSSVQAMTSVLLPLLKRGNTKKVINISTSMGSIALVKNYAFAPTHAYKITKAALNMLNAQYAMDFADQGFTFLAVSPGWLKTDMGSERADLEVSVGAESVKTWILKADSNYNGKAVSIHVPGWENVEGPNKYDGKEIPW